METIEKAYHYLFHREVPEAVAQGSQNKSLDVLESTKETYRQADIKVLQQMISMGYDPSSVINDYEKISVFSEALKESGSPEKAVAAYHNEVTAIVLAEAQKEGRA